jgi:hypothetical protein
VILGEGILLFCYFLLAEKARRAEMIKVAAE